jgi:hypothetical protein
MRSGPIGLLLWLPCASAGLGCSISGGSNAAACSYSGALPPPPSSSLTQSGGGFDDGTLPQGVSVQAFAEGLGRQYLDAYVGDYLRGKLTVYHGTLSANDDQSVLGIDCNGGSDACADQSIPNGPAVASLTVDADAGTATLTVHSLAAHKYVAFQQTAAMSDVTTVGVVLPDTSTGGNTGTCSGCVTEFGNTPTSISIRNLDGIGYVAVNPPADASQGTVNDAGEVVDAYAGVKLDIHASGALVLGTPCELTFDDLAELNAFGPPLASSVSAPVGFQQQGDEMVALVQGSAYSYDQQTDNGCVTYYTIELYVSTTNLADYGVRNFAVVHPDAGYYEQFCDAGS